jgi:hypothetical protein
LQIADCGFKGTFAQSEIAPEASGPKSEISFLGQGRRNKKAIAFQLMACLNKAGKKLS